MNEDALIKKIRDWCESTRTTSTTLGIGDDAAIITLSGTSSLFCSDLMIEHTHFDLRFSSAADVGHKALARSLSDIAAMGGQPDAVTISLALPGCWRSDQIEKFLAEFYQGATAIAIETKISIAGGDLSRLQRSPEMALTPLGESNEPIVIDIAALGHLQTRQTPWLRSGAAVGDLAYVTGSLGGAAHALSEMQAGRGAQLNSALAARHLRPRPRFDVVERLRDTPIISAMDISDGLVQDATRMCRASGVSLILETHAVPIDPGLKGIDRLRYALTGGDDYELLFAVPERWANSEEGQRLLATTGCTCIGRFEKPEHPFRAQVLVKGADGRHDAAERLCEVMGQAAGHDPFRDT